MLFRYFLRQFFTFFILAFAGLIPLFASCDMAVRLTTLPFSVHILKLFLFMVPLAALFALPIASCCAVGMTVGNIFTRDESLLLHFFASARKKIFAAVMIFSGVIACIYIPLVFYWAPSSYWFGKQFLIKAAQQQIEHLPAKKFHTISSQGTVFFKNKSKTSDGAVQFEDILLMIKEKNDKNYLVTARTGRMNKEMLFLSQGTIYNNAAQNYMLASFTSLDIAFHELFFPRENGKVVKPIKFLTWDELLLADSADPAVDKEWHKRMDQILWQILFPLLMFFSMMVWGKTKSNLVLSVVLSGLFFLGSYIHSNMAYFLVTQYWYSKVLFYLIPMCVLVFLYSIYSKKWPA